MIVAAKFACHRRRSPKIDECDAPRYILGREALLEFKRGNFELARSLLHVASGDHIKEVAPKMTQHRMRGMCIFFTAARIYQSLSFALEVTFYSRIEFPPKWSLQIGTACHFNDNTDNRNRKDII